MNRDRSPNRDGVIAAAQSIAAILPPTPLLPLRIGETSLWAKVESLQPIGAFKIRGAWSVSYTHLTLPTILRV